MVIFSAHIGIHERITEPPQPELGDLVLSSGEFLLTDTGVTARLRPPLERFSGHYNWIFLPKGLAALRLLVVEMGNEEGAGIDLIVDLLKISEDDRDQLEHCIGHVNWHVGPDKIDVCEHESELLEDVFALCQWGATLATRCPYASAAQDLSKIPGLSRTQLSQMVLG